MSKSGMFEFVSITAIFLCVLPVMFTLMVAVLLNSSIVPEIRIGQAAIIVVVSGFTLYASVTYFITKLHRQIEFVEKEKV